MYRGKTFEREQVYLCGNYLDGDIYPVFQMPGKRRRKCRPTSAVQKRLNQKNAEKKLTRTVHRNFTEQDLALHLTYAERVSKETALRLVQNYLKCLKRRYQRAGLVFKYILTTECGKQSGRVHHHLIVSGGMDRDELERLWKHGYANSRRLQFNESGVAGLAHYISKGGDGGKRWSGSRNLVQPEPEVREGAVSVEEAHALAAEIENGVAYDWFQVHFGERYPGFELVDCEAYHNGVNQGWYIHFEMRRTE